MKQRLPNSPPGSPGVTLGRFCVVFIFGVAFAYIEAAVVVYLREIFYPDGFSFPLPVDISAVWSRLLLTEVGREAATVVLILTGAWLFGRSRAERFAYFLTIFAVWDIFYYVWLKVLLDWPGSILDWDILFLIPVAWAGPVLAPVLVSAALVVFAVIILYCCRVGRAMKASLAEWFGFAAAALILVVSFCIAGLYITDADFRGHFNWPLFGLGYMLGVVLFLKCLLKDKTF